MLFVGLGNPSDKYRSTRHNVGFMVIDYLVNRFGIEMQSRFDSQLGIGEINGERHYFLKPLTFMNLSGRAVRLVADFYKLDISSILVIHDELNIDFGSVKLRHNGSSGGHNGIASIIDSFGSADFKRLKIGIGNDKSIDQSSYVLRNFKKEELGELEDILVKSIDIISMISADGMAKAMTEYNRQIDKI